MAVGALVTLSGQTALMVGSAAAAIQPDALWLVLTETAFGQGLAVRLMLAAALLAAIALKAPQGVLLALGAAATASMALIGHAAGGDGVLGLTHQAADAMHMLAAAVWVGALLAFSRAAFGPTATIHTQQTQRALARFGGLGSALVAVLLLTGLINVTILVTPAGVLHLTESDYGWLLLIKLAAFAMMLFLAATNRFVLTPRLAKRLASGAAPDSVLKALRASLVIETALGMAVLGLVAVLGRLPPVVESWATP